MSGRGAFDDALDRAIDALNRGEQLDGVVARDPRHADALRPLLETMQQAQRVAPAPADMSSRLDDHYSIVRAAVQRAQMAAQPVPQRTMERPAWWRRRLTVASLSLPAGVVLLAVASISGAAAASIAVAGDIGEAAAVVDLVKRPQHWLPGTGGGHGGKPVTAGGNAPASAATGSYTVTPGSENKPTLMTLDGTISGVHGDVFTLTTADGTYQVNMDGTTNVTGSIADGAKATVTGDVTAEKNMHAESVAVTAEPNIEQTPAQENDRTHAPGPPVDRTPGPPGDHTPSGSAGDGGNDNSYGGR